MKKNIIILLAVLLCACSVHQIRPAGDELRLRLKNPAANKVVLYCSFDGFEPHPASRIDDRTWEVSVPLHDNFSYFYLVDDKLFMPPCRQSQNDDFGGTSCVYHNGL